MKILSCDTSTLLGSVAISEGSQILSSRSLQRAGSHSDTLNVMINECLKESGFSFSDIDLFVSGLGPGSFTGIRISLNTIKTLAFTQNKPCTGFDSLFLIAEQAKLNANEITVMINAFKNMVYIAEYAVESGEIKAIHSPQVLRVQELEKFLNPQSLILGDGYLAYENYFQTHLKIKLKRDPEVSDFPVASTLCHLFKNRKNTDFVSAEYHWSRLIPLYLRASEAEENLKGIKYQPLAMR